MPVSLLLRMDNDGSPFKDRELAIDATTGKPKIRLNGKWYAFTPPAVNPNDYYKKGEVDTLIQYFKKPDDIAFSALQDVSSTKPTDGQTIVFDKDARGGAGEWKPGSFPAQVRAGSKVFFENATFSNGRSAWKKDDIVIFRGYTFVLAQSNPSDSPDHFTSEQALHGHYILTGLPQKFRTWAGSGSSAVRCFPGEIVKHNNAFWKCLRATSANVEPGTNSSIWLHYGDGFGDVYRLESGKMVSASGHTTLHTRYGLSTNDADGSDNKLITSSGKELLLSPSRFSNHRLVKNSNTRIKVGEVIYAEISSSATNDMILQAPSNPTSGDTFIVLYAIKESASKTVKVSMNGGLTDLASNWGIWMYFEYNGSSWVTTQIYRGMYDAKMIKHNVNTSFGGNGLLTKDQIDSELGSYQLIADMAKDVNRYISTYHRHTATWKFLTIYDIMEAQPTWGMHPFVVVPAVTSIIPTNIQGSGTLNKYATITAHEFVADTRNKTTIQLGVFLTQTDTLTVDSSKNIKTTGNYGTGFTFTTSAGTVWNYGVDEQDWGKFDSIDVQSHSLTSPISTNEGTFTKVAIINIKGTLQVAVGGQPARLVLDLYIKRNASGTASYGRPFYLASRPGTHDLDLSALSNSSASKANIDASNIIKGGLDADAWRGKLDVFKMSDSMTYADTKIAKPSSGWGNVIRDTNGDLFNSVGGGATMITGSGNNDIPRTLAHLNLKFKRSMLTDTTTSPTTVYNLVVRNGNNYEFLKIDDNNGTVDTEQVTSKDDVVSAYGTPTDAQKGKLYLSDGTRMPIPTTTEMNTAITNAGGGGGATTLLGLTDVSGTPADGKQYGLKYSSSGGGAYTLDEVQASSGGGGVSNPDRFYGRSSARGTAYANADTWTKINHGLVFDATNQHTFMYVGNSITKNSNTEIQLKKGTYLLSASDIVIGPSTSNTCMLVARVTNSDISTTTKSLHDGFFTISGSGLVVATGSGGGRAGSWGSESQVPVVFTVTSSVGDLSLWLYRKTSSNNDIFYSLFITKIG